MLKRGSLTIGGHPRACDLENHRLTIAGAGGEHARQQPAAQGVLDLQPPPGGSAVDQLGDPLKPRPAASSKVARHKPRQIAGEQIRTHTRIIAGLAQSSARWGAMQTR